MTWEGLDVTVRPIRTWPGPQTEARKPSPFSAPWTSTVWLLAREMRMLGAKDVVLEMAIAERDLRKDGLPRADARPSHPGVILSFDSIHGPLRYPCDTYPDWQDNVRAIALALEALRAVDRYGVTRRAEQYTGWKAIAAPGAEMTPEQAAHYLSHAAHGNPHLVEELLRSPGSVREAFRSAAFHLHPDRDARDPEAFKELTRAKRVLDRHHGRG